MSSETVEKKLPNILITGTPGCGKTQHCERLKELIDFNFINVSDLVKNNNLYESYDEEYETYIIDEDKLLDELEGPIAKGGVVIDHHTCGFFPKRFFNLVVVLRCNNTVLYDRLEARGYNEKKLDENMEAEIMQVVADEARDSYDESIIVELTSESSEELEENCQRIVEWISNYMQNPSTPAAPAAEEDEDDDEDEQ